MAEMVNLMVDLDARFDSEAYGRAQHTVTAMGFTFEQRVGADDRTLAWIDAEFGGTWSAEAYDATDCIALRNGEPMGFAALSPQLRYRWLRGIAREAGVGVFGPFGVARSERGGALGPALLGAALAGLRAQGYRRALIPAVSDARLIHYYTQQVDARIVERFRIPNVDGPKPRVVVLASGGGSNFQAMFERVAAGTLPLDIVALVSNSAGAFALTRAFNIGVPSQVLEWDRVRETRAQYDRRLLAALRDIEPELVLLLGWMHVLDTPFVRTFPQILNLHPAYLPHDPTRDDVGLPDGTRIPAFRGAHAVRDALAAQSGWIGASVHRVTTATDRGEILIRAPLRIGEREPEDELFARLHELEHEIVARAAQRWLNEGD